jgi:thiol-disulfide isomerase/thioredoxin
MAVESTMQPLGSTAPDFELLDVVSGQLVSLSSVRSSVATVVMFICNHCPYVKHVQGQLVAVAHDYQPKGVSFVAINANDADQYPDDGPDRMAAVAAEQGYPFPYLHDQTQDVARAYGAVCTPDLFVYDGDLALAYRGRLDASTPGNGQPNDGADLRAALDALLAGHPAPADQVPSMGCSIKWR